MRIALVLTGLSLLAACGEPELSPQEQERRDAAAVAEVEAAQTPPAMPIDPQAISFADIERENLFGAGCAFLTGAGGGDPIVLTQRGEGYMKLDGAIVRFAADPGSDDLPLGTRRKYTGGEYAFEVIMDPGSGSQSGMETVDYPGSRLTVRDGRSRTVFQADGLVQCGS